MENYDFEPYVFSHGIYKGKEVTDERQSRKLFLLKETNLDKHTEDVTSYTWDERGMSHVFGHLYSDEARFCPEFKSWMVYNGCKWVKDSEGSRVSKLLDEFVDFLIYFASDIENESTQDAFLKLLGRMGDTRYRERIMRDARHVLSIDASQFDSKPELLNCLNGTIDLHLREFRPARYDDYLTKSTNVRFTTAWNEESGLIDPALDSVKWVRFIKEITQADTQKALYLQKALGYSIMGTGNAECMFILHGKTTRNGKSTMLDAITNVLGDYSTTAPVELICKSNRNKDAEAPSPVLARLKGRRFVTMAESTEGGKLDESVLKQLTGGEEITARELHQSPITFKPQFTMWLSCNSLPEVDDKSLFASDRLRVIEFNRHFKLEEQNPYLKEEFRQEEQMKGILNWLLEGYYYFLDEGLQMPAHMQKVVAQYRRDNDNVIQFLEEMCEKDSEATIRSNSLYTTFKNWCRNNNARQCSAKVFNKELDTHVEWIIDSYQSGGYKNFRGIKLKNQE